MKPSRRHELACLGLGLVGLLGPLGPLSCKPTSTRSSGHAAKVASAAPVPAPKPKTLLALDRPAYHATLHLDGDLVYALMNDAIYVLAPGQAPRRFEVDLGFVAAATQSAFVYWKDGWLMRVPKLGGEPAKMGKVARPPQYLLAAGERVAWIDKDTAGRYSVQVLAGSVPKAVHASTGMVAAAAMVGDRVVYAERNAPNTFRLVSVPTTGDAASFGESRRGRTPSMLASFAGRVAYYDGNVYEVRSLSADLRDEQVVGSDVICSPLALADRVYCGRVEGLSVVSSVDHAVSVLMPNLRTMVTALAADPHRVVAILDAAGKMEVRLLTFR